MVSNNIFENLPEDNGEEIFENLLLSEKFCLKRITSRGQATPENEWYDQEEDEWVILLKGKATLLIEGEEEITLTPGDHILLHAHCRHRVTSTDTDGETIWLALHY